MRNIEVEHGWGALGGPYKDGTAVCLVHVDRVELVLTLPEARELAIKLLDSCACGDSQCAHHAIEVLSRAGV